RGGATPDVASLPLAGFYLSGGGRDEGSAPTSEPILASTLHVLWRSTEAAHRVIFPFERDSARKVGASPPDVHQTVIEAPGRHRADTSTLTLRRWNRLYVYAQ